MARRNGSTNAAPVSAEQATETQTSASEAPAEVAPADTAGASEAPPTAQPGEQEPPRGEPGPEDFARHTGARLVADHEQDLRLAEEIERRIAKRAEEIATRTRKRGANAVVVIGDKTYQPRAKPGGGMLLAAVKERFSASLD